MASSIGKPRWGKIILALLKEEKKGFKRGGESSASLDAQEGGSPHVLVGQGRNSLANMRGT